MPLTAAQTIAATVVISVAAAGAAAWYLRASSVADAYAEAAADCQAGRGDARLRALDQLHGRETRPRALALDLSLCAMDGATDRYIGASRAADALQP